MVDLHTLVFLTFGLVGLGLGFHSLLGIGAVFVTCQFMLLTRYWSQKEGDRERLIANEALVFASCLATIWFVIK